MAKAASCAPVCAGVPDVPTYGLVEDSCLVRNSDTPYQQVLPWCRVGPVDGLWLIDSLRIGRKGLSCPTRRLNMQGIQKEGFLYTYIARRVISWKAPRFTARDTDA